MQKSGSGLDLTEGRRPWFVKRTISSYAFCITILRVSLNLVTDPYNDSLTIYLLIQIGAHRLYSVQRFHQPVYIIHRSIVLIIWTLWTFDQPASTTARHMLLHCFRAPAFHVHPHNWEHVGIMRKVWIFPSLIWWSLLDHYTIVISHWSGDLFLRTNLFFLRY